MRRYKTWAALIAVLVLGLGFLLPALSAPPVQLQQLRVVEVDLRAGEGNAQWNSEQLEGLGRQLAELIERDARPAAAAQALRELGQVRWELPAGRYHLARPLVAPRVNAPRGDAWVPQNIRWQLVGQRTHLIFPGDALVIDYTQPQGVYHETAAEADIVLSSLIVTARKGIGLRLVGGGKAVVVRDVEFVDCLAAGWRAERADGLRMYGVKATGCGIGLDLIGCHQVGLDITARLCGVGVRAQRCGALAGFCYTEACSQRELLLIDVDGVLLTPGWSEESQPGRRAPIQARRCQAVSIVGQAHTDSADLDLDEATALLSPALSHGYTRAPDYTWGAGSVLRVPHDVPGSVVAGSQEVPPGTKLAVDGRELRVTLPADAKTSQMELFCGQTFAPASGDTLILRAEISGDAAAEAGGLRAMFVWSPDERRARAIHCRALRRGVRWLDVVPIDADTTAGRLYLRVTRDAGREGEGTVTVTHLSITHARATAD